MRDERWGNVDNSGGCFWIRLPMGRVGGRYWGSHVHKSLGLFPSLNISALWAESTCPWHKTTIGCWSHCACGLCRPSMKHRYKAPSKLITVGCLLVSWPVLIEGDLADIKPLTHLPPVLVRFFCCFGVSVLGFWFFLGVFWHWVILCCLWFCFFVIQLYGPWVWTLQMSYALQCSKVGCRPQYVFCRICGLKL